MGDRHDDKGAKSGERLCAAACLATALAFQAFVLIDGRVSLAEQARLTSAFLGIAAFIGIGAVLAFAFVELVRSGLASGWTASPAAAVRGALAQRWRDDRLVSLAWPVAVFLLLVPAFNAFKQRILPAAGFELDPALAAIDRAMFGGDPGVWLHQAVATPATTLFLDAVYHSWFMPTTLGICLVALCAGPHTRSRYMLAYVSVWVLLGAVGAWLLPAAGPAFYAALVDPAGAAPFEAVRHSLAASGGQARFLTSLGNQAYLLDSLDAPTLVIGGGISAIPSVHNAMATLFALCSFRADRRLGIVMLLYAGLIWIGSVYLNWHYAIDGLAGIAGAVAIWWAAGVAVDRLGRLAEARRLRAAPAALPV